MKKIIITILLTSTIWSCGSRKVNKETLKEEIKTNTSVFSNEKTKDSTKVEKEENYSLKISSESFIKDFTFEPINNDKPFFVGGKQFQNVKVVSKEINNKITQEFDLFKKQVDQRFLENEKTIETLTEENKTLKSNIKQTEREESFFFSIWFWIILAVILALIYWLFNYIKSKNPLS